MKAMDIKDSKGLKVGKVLGS